MIFYFSGTGNSRYVAQMLADITGDDVVSINDYIKNRTIGEFTSEKPYIFISPIYVAAPVLEFEKFIENGTFRGARTAYFIMTCAGAMSGAPIFCRKLCEKKGFAYMGTAEIVMPQNYLIYFKMDDEEQRGKKMSAVEPAVMKIAEAVRKGEPLTEKKILKIEYLAAKPVKDLYYKYFMGAKPFYATQECVRCGRCVAVCPYGNIKMTEEGVRWGDKCMHCMACIGYCPKGAVEYGKRSQGKPRYHCKEYSGKT